MKVVDLITLCKKNNLDLDSEQSYSNLSHKMWRNSITAVFDELQAWEMQHVGEEQFSKGFRFFMDGLTKANNLATDVKDFADSVSQTVGAHAEPQYYTRSKGGEMAGGSLYNH